MSDQAVKPKEFATSPRRDFLKKAGAAAFVAPAVASYLVSDLVNNARAQQSYTTTLKKTITLESPHLIYSFHFQVNASTQLTTDVMVTSPSGQSKMDGASLYDSSYSKVFDEQFSSPYEDHLSITNSLTVTGTYYLTVQFFHESVFGDTFTVTLTATGPLNAIENLVQT